MIARLRGLLDSAGTDHAVIDVNGVGYLVFAAGRTLDRLPKPGEQVTLLIDTHVGEDHIRLYGFLDATERDWFRLLMTVQGVGARVALAILSALTPDQIAQAIAVNDPKLLVRADGVGPKLAARIVNELKDKTAHLSLAFMTASQAVAAARLVTPAHAARSAASESTVPIAVSTQRAASPAAHVPVPEPVQHPNGVLSPVHCTFELTSRPPPLYD